uniref:Uncharacterized protein n=1 Tax=Candidatus Kentrum sp. MB TaxID=2138164 RepID=A0A450XB35_9GAMM|nr:MAG: hypothetical protein BECKMB1821G_GA0114241_100338 [Candidatus Kentron sp. MB]VFK26534.1 MAG: hypothetical protein BECKMB1821I_GA0114274_100125 [Candidatus Kentron sp. MB]VFK74558.1 MAG: hypothetical protein BECKMB1821H_GA0114242_100649 [Candidatus Kentron sp. MB]
MALRYARFVADRSAIFRCFTKTGKRITEFFDTENLVFLFHCRLPLESGDESQIHYVGIYFGGKCNDMGPD